MTQQPDLSQVPPSVLPATAIALDSAQLLLEKGDLAGAGNRIFVGLMHQLTNHLSKFGYEMHLFEDVVATAFIAPENQLSGELKELIKKVTDHTQCADSENYVMSEDATANALIAAKKIVANLLTETQLVQTSEADMPQDTDDGESVDTTADIEAEEVGQIPANLEEFEISDKNDQPIIVPWDFTELSGMALKHALELTKEMKRPILLLHIVKKNSEIPAATKQLNQVVSKIQSDFGVTISYIVKEGNIFTDISEVADSHEAEMVIMGTHGIKGMQKITGSWALKVIIDTKAPFIVIQEKPQDSKIDNVVIPITHIRDLKKILNEVRLLDKYFHPTFHLVRTDKFSTDTQKKQAISNFVFVKSFMKQTNMKYTDNEMKGVKSYYDAAIMVAEKVKADLIMVLTTKDIQLQDYMMGAEEQKIIVNASKIPVMCINPMQVHAYSVGALMR